MNTTICAVSTPPGIGGIAVIRISGPETIKTVSEIWKGKDLSSLLSHTAHLGTILDTDKNTLDQVLLTLFRAPGSFTGEDVIEISVHGSTYIQQEILRSLISAGARLAQPGEFTRRAFMNRKIDLVQTDAIASLIHSTNKATHNLAINQMRGNVSDKLKELRQSLLKLSTLLELELDFSEEEVEFADRLELIRLAEKIQSEIDTLKNTFKTGKAIKEGVAVAIIGPTNAGKSSLLNTLLQDNKAIVSEIHGTTRDTIEDTAIIDGIEFRFIDTAGLRETTDKIEKLGIERSRIAAKQANIILIVTDRSSNPDYEELRNILETDNLSENIIHISNKYDLAPTPAYTQFLREFEKKRPHIQTIHISTKTEYGIETLRKTLVETILPQPDLKEAIIITNALHYQSLNSASQSNSNIINGLQSGVPTDLIVQDVRETISCLGEITGEITSSEILQNIFANFCIGK